MMRRITDMPLGTIGFEAVGDVDDDAWEDAVAPVLRQELAEGRKVRLLYALAPRTREVMADTGFRARHAESLERVAVVSDEDWMRPTLRTLAFILPGRAKGFRVRELAHAKAWLAADPD
jgi:hypothetical protein